VIYGKSYGMVYLCYKCQAWVGVHAGTDKALGRLGNAELRKWKKSAHFYFDGLWRKKIKYGFSRKVARTTAYLWLSQKMHLSTDLTHIGMFDVEQCKKVVELCKKYYR
jgi:hypothetical protein